MKPNTDVEVGQKIMSQLEFLDYPTKIIKPMKKREKKQTKGEETTQPNQIEFKEKASRDQQNSLGQLAVNFIKIAANSAEGNVDLHHAANVMNVKKRRIYDVTNVLQGIGLFHKTAKNNVGWKYGDINNLRLFQ